MPTTVSTLKPNNKADTEPGRWKRIAWFADRDKIQNEDGNSYAQITDTKLDIITQGTGTQTIFSLKQGTSLTPFWIDANGTVHFRTPLQWIFKIRYNRR